MKISKKKQKTIKKRILDSAVELISSKGYKKASMSKIAKKAEISEATIYNYFPTKEHILYEYYYQLQVQTKQILLETSEFNEFSLKEQLEFLIHTQLELLKKDRNFIVDVYKELYFKTYNKSLLEKGHNELSVMIEELLDISVEAKEIEEFPYKESIVHLLCDYIYGVIYYWIYDDSENFENTLVMTDKSLDVIYAVFQSGLISKVEQLLSFVIKTHLLNHIKPSKKFKKRVFGS